MLKDMKKIRQVFLKIPVFIKSRSFQAAVIISIPGIVILAWKTGADLMPVPDRLVPDASDISRMQILDRNHTPLNITYENRWNTHDYVPLYEIPEFLQKIFIISEDKRFYSHSGIDWLARFNAAWQNLKAMGGVRGASTISEQVVKMLHPRPRSVWARWLEGFEAMLLEKRFSKSDILEFYLNQVPYASNRRGVVQASRYYFDRDPDTLSRKEILALAVMVRAPSRYNIKKDTECISGPVKRLAALALKGGLTGKKETGNLLKEKIRLKDFSLDVDAGHFVDFISRKNMESLNPKNGRIITTLDSGLQIGTKTLLDSRIHELAKSGVHNGALLIVHNRTGEVLAWVVSGDRSIGSAGSWINAVDTPRQPGSTLKPFVYTIALERGWTAATIIDDSPLSEPVGTGLHSYHNYSRIHYGTLSLRESLGNSLNIPALKALRYVGVEDFLSCLQDLGVKNLRESPDYYGDGLVLGNGEITLFELVQAYSALACRGMYKPLKVLLDEMPGNGEYPQKVFSPEAASLIGNILSDANARKLEFGTGGLLNFPVQTAVKTGTSNDYRDAWAVGYNNEYTVGVWMGNLDRTPMVRITGARGPAVVLRSVFAELNRNRDTEPLYLSPKLVSADVRASNPRSEKEDSPIYSEWFIPGTGPEEKPEDAAVQEPAVMVQPSPGLMLAMDPRIPDDHESFMFRLTGIQKNSKVRWFVDNELKAVTGSGEYLWPVSKGSHTVTARIRMKGKETKTEPVTFFVK